MTKNESPLRGYERRIAHFIRYDSRLRRYYFSFS